MSVPRFYYQFTVEEQWAVFDRELSTPQGGPIAITTHCVNRHYAERIRDALNFHNENCDASPQR